VAGPAIGIACLYPDRAAAHQILEIAYYVQRDNVDYVELGPDYFDRRRREHAVQRHIEQLQALG
jgi:transposase